MVKTGSVLSILAAMLMLAGDGRAQTGTAGTAERSDAAAGMTSVEIFYATNRRYYAGQSAGDSYSGERGHPDYGRCRVRFTPIPLVNDVAADAPFYIPGETRSLQAIERLSPELFRRQLQDASSDVPVIVFVHGYNYDFERSCRMIAPLQRMLGERGSVVMLSWPADGNPAQYVADQVDVDWSVPFLAEFTAMLGDRIGVDNIHVIAHSMGSRGMVHALQRLRADRGSRRLLNQLVLLAPDFDSETFIGLLPRLTPLAQRITLYASGNDTPLKVSRQLNGYPRLGEAGDYLTVVAGMETIDVSPVGRYQFLGHEYFYYHPLVAADLVELLTTNRPAGVRRGLRRSTKNGLDYWEIVESEPH